ncbi:MAG: hypothetical protein QM632_03910 [Micrococcaceae bacterium]
MNPLFNYLLPVIIIGFFIYRMYSERRLKESLKIVLILLAYGILTMVQALQGTHLSISVLASYIVGTVILGFIFGAIRGYTDKIRYSETEKSWVRKGTIWTIAVFLIGMIVNAGLKFLIDGQGPTSDIHILTGSSTMIHIAVSILGSRIVLLNRKNRIAVE